MIYGIQGGSDMRHSKRRNLARKYGIQGGKFDFDIRQSGRKIKLEPKVSGVGNLNLK